MNSGLSVQVSLFHVVEPSDHSVSNHLLPSPELGSVLAPRLTGEKSSYDPSHPSRDF